MQVRVSLSTKLLSLMLVIVAIPILTMVGLSLYLRQALQADVERKIETTLTLAQNMEDGFVAEGLVTVRQVASAMSTDSDVITDMTGQPGPINLRRFTQVFPRADLLLLVDRSGRVVSRSTTTITGDRISLDGLVEQAIVQGKAQAYPAIIPASELQNESGDIREQVDVQVLQTSLSTDPRIGTTLHSALALVGVVPIQDADGTVVGAAVAVDILNHDFRIVDEVVSRAPPDLPMNATIALDGIRVTTNVPLKDPDGKPTDVRAVGTVYSDTVMKALRAGKEYRGRAQVVGEWQRAIYRPIRDVHGNVIAGSYVGVPEAYFTAVTTGLNHYVLLAAEIGAAALLFAFVLGWWLMRQGIVNPLRRFTQQIQTNNLTTPIVHTAADEIGALATALDDLMRRIREVVGRVQAVADEVAGASTALHDSAVTTNQEATTALTKATETLASAQQLQSGAQQTIARIMTLSAAVESIAEGTRRQERSVRYTGVVATEIVRTMDDLHSLVDRATDSVSAVAGSARAGLRRAADFTAAVGILQAQMQDQEGAARALELLRDPSDLLVGTASAAERLADMMRRFTLEVQENEARLASIRSELEQVGRVCETTTGATQQAGENTQAIVGWMQSMTEAVAEAARDMESTRAAIDGIAEANRRLGEMAANMQEASGRLHEALERAFGQSGDLPGQHA